ncbi:MAG: chromate resistance protein ChrB domain-containing protein [Pseudomonadota bacterium]
MGEFKISIDELKRTIGTAIAPRVIDVRRRAAFEESDRALPTAEWRDAAEAEVWAAHLASDRPIVVYCAHGAGVSQSAAAALRAAGHAAQALAGGYEGWRGAGGPTVLNSAVTGRPSRWVTRTRPKIDRIACPWLIRRFVDRDARFYFVEPDQVTSAAQMLGAIPYDVEGVELSHEGELCTFDILLRHFGLDDPALLNLAPIVRGADTARLDLAPEAAGLLAVSLGISSLAGADDHYALERGFAIYDALLAWRRFAVSERHNWPARAR